MLNNNKLIFFPIPIDNVADEIIKKKPHIKIRFFVVCCKTRLRNVNWSKLVFESS